MRPLETVASETGVDLATVRKVAAALSKDRKPGPEVVALRHPKLPTDQVITVDRRRIDARLAAGWVEVDPPAAEPESKSEPAPEPEKSRRPRRKSSEDEI